MRTFRKKNLPCAYILCCTGREYEFWHLKGLWSLILANGSIASCKPKVLLDRTLVLTDGMWRGGGGGGGYLTTHFFKLLTILSI